MSVEPVDAYGADLLQVESGGPRNLHAWDATAAVL